MNFSNDWFGTTGQKNFEKYLAEFKGKPAKFLEIGCFEGRATVWMLENILTNPSAHITVIDTFEGSIEHKDFNMDLTNLYDIFKENTKDYSEKVSIWKGKSQEILREEIGETWDFIYVDGSHQAPDVLEDAILAFRHLAPGGIMIFDDAKWAKYEDPRMNPGLGIEAFLSVFGNKFEVLFKAYQVGIRKNG